MTDTQEAITQIEEEIAELQQQKELINNLYKLDLNEDTFHILCKTYLRISDTLGKLVGDKLNLKYESVSSNYFQYKLDNGWKVSIPSYNSYSIEIHISNYMSSDWSKSPKSVSILNKLLNLKEKLNESLEFINTEHTQYRADKIFKHCKLKLVRRLMYLITNPMYHYVDRYKKQINKLSDTIEDLEETYLQNQYCYAKNYRQQRLQLQKYIKTLLTWTKEIRIYEEGCNIIKETIKGEN